MEINRIEKKILAAAIKIAARKYGVSIKAIREKNGVGENMPYEIKCARGCFVFICYEAGARQAAAAHYIHYPNSNATIIKKWFKDRTPATDREELLNALMDRL